ncbi:esterase-like activity of phytase family protein [Acuticoccus sp. M5D2P5]|uniref:esterase-like activity of phytase family protein n=1 Tax=Acuticoccus kalidii TaxID=2910977 RepID=UPI001F2CB5D7|nr:esterase-like activity of phytase family protein [Acuticoccus kalidii]MCF3934253.1 esterase-like activity of phytase family protein [Acuticoccus kalidii]
MTIRSFTLLAALMATTAAAHAETFNRIASFEVPRNLPDGTPSETPTSAEIIAATADGMMLAYTDSPLGAVGLVDISDPKAPAAVGAIMLGGEPTSLAILGESAFVAVNTSESYTDPSGILKVVDLAGRTVSDSCDLGGQPDSVALAPGGAFLAIAIENERDEDLDDGAIPQMPAGNVVIIPLSEEGPDCDAMITADLTGLAEIAPEDPEPEFVDINAAGAIAVTLQENNHIVILAPDGTVTAHFPAGEVTLDKVDTARDGAIDLTGTVTMKREPDSVKWIGEDHLVVANEGDYEGGARGFTIFGVDGTVAYEAGASLEYALIGAGHYPDKRSDKKGIEPEGLEVATFGETTYLFVLSERGSAVGVYALDETDPTLTGILPSGIAPEGAVAIPQRNLFVTANEADLIEDGGVRAHVMIYALQDAPAAYPTIVAAASEIPAFGWGALSGLAADPANPTTLYAVSDSFYSANPAIFTIDAATTPATITASTTVTRDGAPAEKLDLEGIVSDGEGGFWLANEGNSEKDVPHALYHVDASGAIIEEVPFPDALLAGERRFGAEGVTKIGDRLWIAIQREWGDDPKGHVKLVSYDLTDGSWGAVRYPLEAAETGWMGLSEITAFGDTVYVIERDNQIGSAAKVKAIYAIPAAELEPQPLGGELPTVTKTLAHDAIPDLARFGGYTVDKLEGFAVGSDGTAYFVTDNDGVDDSSGETFFWSVGDFAN